MSARVSGEFQVLLRDVLARDSRYPVEAYSFVMEALDFTIRKFKTPRHITASELLEGIRQHGIKSFGPMSRTVLESWKIQSCKDFGEIVFHLVDCGLLARQESDSKTDFKEGYDFEEAFEKPFQF